MLDQSKRLTARRVIKRLVEGLRHERQADPRLDEAAAAAGGGEMIYLYTLHRLGKSAEAARYRFESYEAALSMGGIRWNLYQCVASGTIEAAGQITACEKIYERFNVGEKPEGYKGRSMSVSDIVHLVTPDGQGDIISEDWYCDNVGFRKIDQWAR